MENYPTYVKEDNIMEPTPPAQQQPNRPGAVKLTAIALAILAVLFPVAAVSIASGSTGIGSIALVATSI